MKKGISSLVPVLTAVALFNLVFWICGLNRPAASVWIAYSVIHLAALLDAAAVTNSSLPEMRISARLIGGVHLGAQILVGFIIIAIAPQNYKAGLFVEIVILIAAVAFTVLNLQAEKDTAAQLETGKSEIEYVRTAASAIKAAAALTADADIKKEILHLYDVVHSSPAQSSPNARDSEIKVMEETDALKRALSSGDTAAAKRVLQAISRAAAERNSLI